MTHVRVAGPASKGVVALAALALAAGCTSARPHDGLDDETWSRIALPEGFEPALLAGGSDGSLLVAADGEADGSPAPRLLRLRRGSVAAVAVRPSTYYGRRAVWRGIAAHGDEVYAVGGRSGGAHGNTRWTVWSGRSRLEEDVQPFETFGGPRAGSLSDLVVAESGSPVLVGSRVQADGGGLDIVVWDLAGRRWVQRPSGGTPLAADDGQQPAAHWATRRARGLLLVGSVSATGEDGARTRPVVWSASGPRGDWHRLDLPAGRDVVDEAQAAACDGRGACLVVGSGDGRLRGWWVGSDDQVTALDLPDLPADPAQVLLGADDDLARWAVTVGGPGAPRMLLGRRHDGTEATAPPGMVVGLAIIDGAVWAVSRTRAGAALWRR